MHKHSVTASPLLPQDSLTESSHENPPAQPHRKPSPAKPHALLLVSSQLPPAQLHRKPIVSSSARQYRLTESPRENLPVCLTESPIQKWTDSQKAHMHCRLFAHNFRHGVFRHPPKTNSDPSTPLTSCSAYNIAALIMRIGFGVYYILYS